MKFPFKKHSQFELFPGSLGHSDKDHKRISLRPITVTWENAVIVMIVFIMGIVVSFSFGVEKGKRLYQKSVSSKMVPANVKEIVVSAEENDGASKERDLKDSKKKVKIFNKTPENGLKMEENVNSITKKNKSIDNIYTVQVASFKYKQRADLMVEDINRSGYDAFSSKAGKYYIVCVGRFHERKEAVNLWKILLRKYSDCLIRSL